MSDLLSDAGAAAGVDPATVEVMREYLRSQDAYVTINFERQYKRQAEREKHEAAEAADAMPDYHGAITRCQARSTQESGRSYHTDRCARKPKKVRRVRESHGSFKGDGRLAVCLQHAKTVRAPDRWVNDGHWQDRGKVRTASEVVEPEYQP